MQSRSALLMVVDFNARTSAFRMQGLNEKKIFAWHARLHHPEELYFRTLYALFLATPDGGRPVRNCPANNSCHAVALQGMIVLAKAYPNAPAGSAL
jgi:hypothetical protein